jgi:C-terminal processing protease CtpA/Prc
MEYLTPEGLSLQDVGIAPDTEATLSADEMYRLYTDSETQDRQLDVALRAVN